MSDITEKDIRGNAFCIMDELSNRRYKILVVDDEPTVSESIKIMLKYHGHEAWTVDNGESAIELCKAEKFDLIITDYFMPDMKGDELSAIIKRDWPEQKILMISAYGNALPAGSKSTSEADAVLSKPFSMEALLTTVAMIIG